MFRRLLSQAIFSSWTNKEALLKVVLKSNFDDDKKTLINVLSKIPGLAVLEGFNHFLETSPAKRVNDVQRIFREQLDNIKKDIFVIIEDIDRSGDSGAFFLETLKQFLKSSNLLNKVVIIVPIANENYYKNIDSYLKCIDYFDFFEQKNIKLDKFVGEVIDNSLLSGQLNRKGDNKLIWSGPSRKGQTISFLEKLFDEMPEMNMRLLKLILRKANLAYKNQTSDGHDPDFRVTLCIEASKYFKINGKEELSYFADFIERGVIIRGNIFSSFLIAMLNNKDSIVGIDYTNGREIKRLLTSPYDFKFIKREDNDKIQWPSYPWSYGRFSGDSGFGVASFYCEY